MVVYKDTDYTYCGKQGDYYIFRNKSDIISMVKELKYIMTSTNVVMFLNELGISMGHASRKRLREEEADAIVTKFEQSRIQL